MHREQAIQHAAVSDVGMRRRNNEDSCAVQLCPDPETWINRGHLFIVADGMGGHAVGELASKLAVDTVPHTFFKTKEGNARISLAEAVHAANRTINSRGTQNRDFQRMGTTCTVLALTRMGAIVAHVGDSRCYRIRRDRIDQLTFDHSIIWELARQRGIPPEKVDLIEHRNVITRSLGPELDTQVDIEGPIPVLPGDVYVLCSDGLTNHLKDDEIAAAARELAPNQATRLLTQLANLRGGSDNCTVVIVRVGDLPANIQPQDPEPAGANSSIGWGWLVVFWVVALGIVARAVADHVRARLQGGFVSGLSLVGLVIVLIGFLREKEVSAGGHQRIVADCREPAAPHRGFAVVGRIQPFAGASVGRSGADGPGRRVVDQVGRVPADRRHGPRIVRQEAPTPKRLANTPADWIC